MSRKKKKFRRVILWSIPFVVTLFLVALFLVLWGVITKYKYHLLIVTGVIIIIYIIMGLWRWRKFVKGLRKRLKRL